MKTSAYFRERRQELNRKLTSRRKNKAHTVYTRGNRFKRKPPACVKKPISFKKLIRNTARRALKQPKISKLKPVSGVLNIGTYDASTNTKATDASVLAYRRHFSQIWTYREYIHAVANADTWRAQYDQYQERVKKHEHDREEARRQYNHKESMAYARLSASENENAVFNEPYLAEESPSPELHLTGAQINFAHSFSRSAHTPDEAGYLTYLKNHDPVFYKQITKKHPFYLLEEHRKQHTYIVGGSGSGKSELLKSIIFNYVLEEESAIVVLDPNGDFAGQVARFPELAETDRLIYLKYNLARNQTFTINPFTISGIAPSDASEHARATRVVVANQLQDAFIQIVSGGSGDDFTINMKALLMPCITTLLEYPNATILDLQRFMNDDLNNDLIAFAKTLRHYPNNVAFFESEFTDKSYSPTKKAVAKKIRSLLNFPPFYHLTCGRNTVDLERYINEKKAIVLSLSKGAIGETVVGAFGRLVVSMLQGMAMRRESLPRSERVPCHLFIDECHTFISPSIEEILVEARKYALHLTMAQQAVGYKMSAQLKKILGINTVIKISGKIPVTAWKDTASYIGAPAHLFEELMDAKGRYIISSAGSPPVVISGRANLLDELHSVERAVWKNTVKKQCALYYRDYIAEEKLTLSMDDKSNEEPADTQDRLGFDIS